jgi:hypothetical protein
VKDGPESIDNGMNWLMVTGIGRQQRESSDSGWESMASNAVKKRTLAVGEKKRKKLVLD